MGHLGNRSGSSRLTAWVLSATLFVIVLLATVRSADPAELIKAAKVGNATAIERLNPISFKVDVQRLGEKEKTSFHAIYYYDGSKYRLKVKGFYPGAGDPSSRTDLDIYSDGSTLRSVSTRGNMRTGKPTGVLEAATARNAAIYDVWALALLSLSLGNNTTAPLSDFLDQSDILEVRRQGTGDAQPDIVIRTRKGGQTAEVVVSTKHNFLVSAVVTNPGKEPRSETRVTKFIEPSPGIFFPARVEVSNVANGKTEPYRVADYSEVKVGNPLPRDAFEFRYPRGVRLLNLIRNETYEADEQGNPIGKVDKPRTSFDPQSSTGERSGDHSPAQLSETTAEPRSWTWLIPVVSILILTLGGAIWLIRRQRTAVQH